MCLLRDSVFYYCCAAIVSRRGQVGISHPSTARKGKEGSLYSNKCEVHCCTRSLQCDGPQLPCPHTLPQPKSSLPSDLLEACPAGHPSPLPPPRRPRAGSALYLVLLLFSPLDPAPACKPGCAVAMQVICMRFAGDAGDTLFGSPEHPANIPHHSLSHYSRYKSTTTSSWAGPIAGAASRTSCRGLVSLPLGVKVVISREGIGGDP